MDGAVALLITALFGIGLAASVLGLIRLVLSCSIEAARSWLTRLWLRFVKRRHGWGPRVDFGLWPQTRAERCLGLADRNS